MNWDDLLFTIKTNSWTYTTRWLSCSFKEPHCTVRYIDLQLRWQCTITFLWYVYILLQSLDLSKPNWTLRVVSDKNRAESIQVKKDTERMDQIKAMKKAWEMAEPGRAARVTLVCELQIQIFFTLSVFLGSYLLFFRLYSLVCGFLTETNIKQVIVHPIRRCPSLPPILRWTSHPSSGALLLSLLHFMFEGFFSSWSLVGNMQSAVHSLNVVVPLLAALLAL